MWGKTWYHRELTKRGAVNYVVAPQLLENQRTKRQKTDRLDARSLLGNLESYLRGNRDAMSIIAVPSPLQEQQRSVVRYREQLMRNRRRAEAWGRALALTQGILAPVGGRWSWPAGRQFKSQLPEWMSFQLENWQEEALALNAKERKIRQEPEQMVILNSSGGSRRFKLDYAPTGNPRLGPLSQPPAGSQLYRIVPRYPQQ